MKKLVLTALSFASCICISACGSEKQTASSGLDIDTEQFVISSESTEETDVYDEIPDSEYPLVPECAENTSSEMRIQDVTINGYTYDITSCWTLQELLEACGLTYVPFAETYSETNGFLFDSGMFGFLYESTSGNDSIANCVYEPDGTMTSIEVLQNGELVSSSDLDESKFGEYIVKGVHADSFFTKADYEVTFCGVKVGMTEKELITAIGEGTPYDESVRFYNNGSAILIVETGTSLDSDTVVVDEITLLCPTDK